jgi:hypothetical protein
MAGTGHSGENAEDPLRGEFDDAWVSGARFKEASAGERARKPGWRARRRMARDARRAGRAKRAGRVRGLAATLLTGLILAVIGSAGWVVAARLIHPGTAAAPQPTAPGSNAGSASPPSAGLASDPFAGSPADSFADGAAGIVLPAAHAVGGYSRAQVRHAYATVKRLLTAADLNQPTLAGGSPRAFARLLTSRQRRFFTGHLARTGFTKRGSSRSTREWLASFAPGSVQFAGNVVKVHGTMRASAATSNGSAVLRIRLDYLFVYPVERPGLPTIRTRVVVRDTRWMDFGHWDSLNGPLEPWWMVGISTAGTLCDASDGYIHADFAQGPAGRVQPSGKPIDPYNQSVLPANGCHPTTRT